MPIHRQIKNVVHNYTETERKVREATSNDAWGPSSTLMAEIADKTHNVMLFTEIMRMIWKRLNDTSKNWRHVHKSLVLLGYLVKSGNEKVATQCRENIHSIETLKDFVYIENGEDFGQRVRVAARDLSSLLRDEERLREERTRALLARDRFVNSSLGSTSSSNDSPHRFASVRVNYDYGLPSSNYLDKGILPTASKSPSHGTPNEIDYVTPHSAHEEQLQLQLVLAMSKEEHDREEERRRTEDIKMQMVLEQSRREEQREKSLKQQQLTAASSSANGSVGNSSTNTAVSTSCLFNLTDSNGSAAPFPDPWSTPRDVPINNASSSNNVASIIPIDDPWNPSHGSESNQTAPTHSSVGALSFLEPTSTINPVSHVNPPFIPTLTGQTNTTDSVSESPFNFSIHSNFTNGDNIQSVPTSTNGTPSIELDNLQPQESQSREQTIRKRTPADFLGEHQNLVDLEKLVVKNPMSTNPFAVGPKAVGGPSSNPFLAIQSPKPSLNELNTNQSPLSTLSHQQQQQLGPLNYPVQPFYAMPQSSFPMSHAATNPWSVVDRNSIDLFLQQQKQPPHYQLQHAHQQQSQPQQTPLNPFY